MKDSWLPGLHPASMKHDDLAHDLALWLSSPAHQSTGFLTWENIEFSTPDPKFGFIVSQCRPDVFAIYSTLQKAKWNPTTYEIKTSVADFQSDVRSKKWQKYLPFSAYVVFAVPELIADKIEVPPECGLIVRRDLSWHKVKRGRKNKNWELTERQWMNLCLKRRNPSPWEIRKTRNNHANLRIN